MTRQLKPIYLLADSQLLFWETVKKELFMNSLWSWMDSDVPRAAYIGASNQDDPIFFDLFKSAMECVGITDIKMIPSSFSDEDQKFLEASDLIMLAGGEVKRGLDIIKQTGMNKTIIKKYYDGALLMGVSAGAIQLGIVGWNDVVQNSDNLFETLKLVPFIVGVHEEKMGWEKLKKVIHIMSDDNVRGIGISTGAGLIYHPDHSIEPVRHPLDEFRLKENQIISSLLCPKINGNGKVDSAETFSQVSYS